MAISLFSVVKLNLALFINVMNLQCHITVQMVTA